MAKATKTQLAAASGLIAAAALLAPGTAWAQAVEDSDEIIITAQKREESLLEVPLSVTALAGDDLLASGATGFADLAGLAPGVNATSSGIGAGQIVIRGVNTGFDASPLTGIVVDGVPNGSSSSFGGGGITTLEFFPFDVERLEILRGPQGTLYGASAMGGLMTYVMRKPDLSENQSQLQVEAASTAEGDGSYAIRGATSFVLTPNQAALRLSAFSDHRGGWIDNGLTGEEEANDSDVSGLRAALRLLPTSRLSIDLSVVHQHAERADSDEVTYSFATGEPVAGYDQQDMAGPTTLDQTFSQGMASVRYDLDSVAVTSLTSYAETHTDLTFDYSPGTFATILDTLSALSLGPDLSAAPVTFVPTSVSTQKFTQELRLESNNQSALQWLIGLYYTQEDTTFAQSIDRTDLDLNAPPGLNPALHFLTDSTFEEIAVFGQATYSVTPALDISAGVRLGRNEQTYRQTTTGTFLPGLNVLFGMLSAPPIPNLTPELTSEESQSTFMLSTRYRLSEDAIVYARAASGYRPGGPNIVIGGSAPSFDSDSIWNYELGWKTRLLDGRGSFELTAFYIDWSDIQLASAIGGLTTYVNGGGATSRGVEGAITITPRDGLTLSGALTYTDAQLEDDAPELGAVAGEPLPSTPNWAGAISIEQRLPIDGTWEAFFGGSVRWVGEREASFDASVVRPQFTLDEYVLTDLRAGVERDGLSLALLVRNATDEHAELGAQTQTGIPTVSLARPRTVTLQLGWAF